MATSITPFLKVRLLVQSEEYKGLIVEVQPPSELMSDATRVLVRLPPTPPHDSKVIAVSCAKVEIVCTVCNVSAADLKMCGTCMSSAYCGRACQASDWPSHKPFCASRASALRAPKDAVVSLPQHPSWCKQPSDVIANLRRVCAGLDLWPLTPYESSPMLLTAPPCAAVSPGVPRGPCFLRSHPAALFAVSKLELPLDDSFRYRNGLLLDVRCPDGSYRDGPKVAKGAFVPVYQIEEIAPVPGVPSLVPPHSPAQMLFIVVGVVRYSSISQIGFQDYYSRQGGRVSWPHWKMIETCPGTGLPLPCNSKESMFLCCQALAASVPGTAGASAKGPMEHWNHGDGMVTRVMPRLISFAGYEIMMGGTKAKTGKHREVEGTNFHPETTERVWKKPVEASFAWELFHEAGSYLAFEKYVDYMRIQRGHI